MTARPILFSAPMVRALLAGTKTQTRRIVKHMETLSGHEARLYIDGDGWLSAVVPTPSRFAWVQDTKGRKMRCPYGVPGDRLWVRETWATGHEWDRCKPREVPTTAPVFYRATPPSGADPRPGETRVSIHMPRWASRLTLSLTDVRVERLQDISEADAQAEGVTFFHVTPGSDPNGWYPEGYRTNYRATWESINGSGSWAANPWAWCLSFTVAASPVSQVKE